MTTVAQNYKNALWKPNSGGFGAGMMRISTTTADIVLQDAIDNLRDDMVLIQQCVPDSNVYRIWFLRGKVQCAVERLGIAGNPLKNGTASGVEFTRGCAAGVCLLNSPTEQEFQAWKVPNEVIQEMEHDLLPLLPDAHAGSVEFLYHHGQ